MAIRKKIDFQKQENIELIRQEVISRGGHVSSDIEIQKPKEWTNFCLRIKTQMMDEIEKSLKLRVGLNKTGWILEAIHKHLREGYDSK